MPPGPAPAPAYCLLPTASWLLVRQVRLELTIPCLRGRCLDPIWLLTQHIVDCRLPIANWPVPQEANRQSELGNRKSSMTLAELNGLEPSSAWLTTKCLTSRPQFLTFSIANCQLQIGVQANRYAYRRELHSHRKRFASRALANRQSVIGNRQFLLGGSKGVEPSQAAVTLRCSAN